MLDNNRYSSSQCLLAGILTIFFALTVDSESAKSEYADIVLNQRAQREGMRPVIFPHWFHRIRFRCKVCHTELGFEMGLTTNNISMSDLIEGRFCGECHNNETAWGIENCSLCHSGTMGLSTGIVQDPEPGGPR